MQAETASLPQSSASDGLPFSEKQVSQHSGNAEPDGTGAAEMLEELPDGIAETEELPDGMAETEELPYGIPLEETGPADEDDAELPYGILLEETGLADEDGAEQ